MTENTKGYRVPGDIEISNFKLVSVRGQIIDIGPIVVEFNIYHNLFEHYLQCELVINDSLGVIQSLGSSDDEIGGFTGGEILAISYRSKDENLPFKRHFFGLYEMSDRMRIDEKNETYVFSGISIEAYNTNIKMISRAYGSESGNTIDNMVKSVVDEFVYNNAAKSTYENYKDILNFKVTKTNTYDTTNGLHKFIIPNLSVDDAINFFCDQADNDKHIPIFVFYETNDGFNFKDIGKLVLQEPKEIYSYLPSNYEEGKNNASEIFADTNKIISYDVERQTNILKNASNGLYSSKTIKLDILRKNKKEFEYEYAKVHEKFDKLQPYKIPGESSESPVNLIISRLEHNNSGSVFREENHLPKKIPQFLPYRNSYKRHIFNTVLEFSIYGNSELQAGDIIYLKIPVASNLNEYDGQDDKYLSGKYIITKLRQKMKGKTGDGFVSIIECAKDTRIR
jgi:hypothetical protein